MSGTTDIIACTTASSVIRVDTLNGSPSVDRVARDMQMHIHIQTRWVHTEQIGNIEFLSFDYGVIIEIALVMVL
jgi:hypothetical protein